MPPRTLPRPYAEYARIDMAAEALGSESDRGAIIFAASLVAESLEAMIRANLRDDPTTVKNIVNPMFDGLGPLATFSAQIKLAYSMKLICKEAFDALELLRKLRNAFAHEPRPLNLDSDAIRPRFVAFANLFRSIGASCFYD